MKRPITIEAYIYLVQSALDDVIDLKMAAEYDMEDMGEALKFVNELESEVNKLLLDLKSGEYKFNDEDLPLMTIVHAQNNLMLPFKTLFFRINDTHRKGLEQN
ncbi:MAG: hypothetical protein ACC653_06370 [Gammaproteobacteria bacterium]